MKLILPGPVLRALSQLEGCGFEAYVVGGCVRDHIMGKTPEEYDLCSAATPEELRACFPDKRLIETGLQHGTLTLILDEMPLEITTFRSDGHYSDGRHPDSVFFSRSIAEDLKRRDFTCNAMAYSPVHGFVDPFKGAEACRNKVLAAVGNPIKRFSEDALRILRAFRFASVLGFSIEKNTAVATLTLSPGLKKISRERIAKELNLAFMGDFVADALREHARLVLAALPQLAPMHDMPEKTSSESGSLWEYTLQVISRTPPDLALRWSALLHESGKPAAVMIPDQTGTRTAAYQGISADIAGQCMASLRQPKKLSNDVRQLVLHHKDLVNRNNLRRRLSELGLDLLKRLLLLQHAVLETRSPGKAQPDQGASELISLAETMVDEGLCLSIKDLKVDGNMLIQAGISEGPAIGEMLSYLLDLVLSDSVPNDRDALLELARKRMNN